MESKDIDLHWLRHYVLSIEYFLRRATGAMKRLKTQQEKQFPSAVAFTELKLSLLKLSENVGASLIGLLRSADKDKTGIALSDIKPLLTSLYLNLKAEQGVTDYPSPTINFSAEDVNNMLNQLDMTQFFPERILSLKCKEVLQDSTPLADRISFFVKAAKELLRRIDDVVQFTGQLKESSFAMNNAILIRQIAFPPEYYQSGMSILSYFGTVIRKKYSDRHIKVRIEQEDLNVKMVIETSEGTEEEIERTLEKYGMVVLGKISPEELFSDKADVLELKQQLNLAKVQLETQRELLALKGDMLKRTDERVAFLELQYNQLTEMVGTTLRMSDTALSRLAALTQQATDANNRSLSEALDLLRMTIEGGVIPKNEEALKNALMTIKGEPGVFSQVYDLLVKGSISGAAGNALYALICNLIATLPR
jgi:hypothetical protein